MGRNVAGGLQLETKPGVESDKQGIKSSTNEAGEKTVSTDQTDAPGADDQQPPPNTCTMSEKPQDEEVTDEEDACSASEQAYTFQPTVPVAPKFICGERLEKCKEYYAKLEERHKALEKEKLEAKARKKEEEEAAIKELRKTMMYRANPVPSFYRAGPPPPKLPLTRPKSPKLSRRSCGDAGKACCGVVRANEHAKGNEHVGGRRSSDNSSAVKSDTQEQEDEDQQNI
ncbi:protein WAVE-DAMPENED 2-like isoform X2 [Salvia splendens]|uniref:protein WAVE-DAMPENED 2-like isoform X2 n=1 Tax=Salvia splendens TaxID=180675 RepID=UPI001C254FD9|nr:protein WAVE-DAMPENED 2-like isoform X2 [Salvia splendens]